MSTGKRIVALRKQKGYTRTALAQKIGIPHTTLRNYELDTREPGHSFLITIAKEFGVSVDYLLGMTDDPQPIKDIPADAFWSPSLINAYASATRPKQEAVCTVLDIPHIVPGKAPAQEEWEELPDFMEPPAAGYANDASPHYEMRRFPARVIPAGTDFSTYANGDSMEPTIGNHDHLFVKASKEIWNNHIGIFRLEDGFVCKRARIDVRGQIIALVSDNPKYPDITRSALRGVEIVGEVLGAWDGEDEHQ